MTKHTAQTMTKRTSQAAAQRTEPNHTARQIAHILAAHHMRPSKFAEGLGVSRQVVYAWRHGLARPSLLILLQFIEAHAPGTWQHAFTMAELCKRFPAIAARLSDQNSNQKA